MLARELIKKYPNVRMVFSGHIGAGRHTGWTRACTATGSTRSLTAMHSNTTNPVRLVQVDTQAKQTLKTWVYAPWTNTHYPSTRSS